MKRYKHLDSIIYLNLTMMAVVNITAGKIIHLGVFTLSAASLCIPITYVIGDTLTEVYGYKESRRATWLLIGSTVLLAVFMQLAIYLPPAPGFAYNQAYTQVLGQVPRVVAGTWAALFAGQFLNDYVLAKMKVLTRKRFLWTRTVGSTVVAQAADTTLFYVIALYNVIPNGLLVHSILSAWCLKVAIEVAITPVTYAVVRWLKRSEQVDAYDDHTNFTPFSLQRG